MIELGEKFINLVVDGDIFKDIKYFITGEVHEKIESLLKSGGAEHQNYFSDYVTHLIVGNNPEENDIADANDVYEIPAVTPKWILMCASLKKLLDVRPYLFITETKLFTGQIFCFSEVQEDREALWGLITFNGGEIHLKLTSKCTFLVTGNTQGPKYEKAHSLGSERIRIVTPDWVVQAVQVKAWPDPSLFHPQLVNWPEPEKPTEPTTAITGFEPDHNAQKVEDKSVPDSTQALLEKLKQRMPWNQPPSTSTTVSTPSSSDPVAPPNVVAPSFLTKMQQANLNDQQFKTPMAQPLISPVGNQSPNHIPRSIIHHTPNNSQQVPPQTSQQNNPLNINRLIAHQNANRQPTSLQQLRGQLNTSQIHQQLLQQRMQSQPNIHRQNLNQHLIHQQRHMLNQQQQQQGMSNEQENLVSQGNVIFNQASPLTNQSNDQRSQMERSPSHNQVMSSPNQVINSPNQVMNSPSQVMSSPQHTHSQIMSPQLHSPINQQNQLLQNNPLLNQQLSQQSPQANQLLQQQQQQQQNQNQNQMMQQQQQQNQTNQQQLLSNQQNKLQNQLLGQQPPQNQLMQQNQQMMQQNHNMLQQNQNQIMQNQQIMQQNELRQNQLINQQNQQIINQGGQQQLLGLPSNHHLSQLSPQQLQQLQQLKREQQQLLNQTQNPMSQQNLGNLGLTPQQNQNPQQIINQNQQIHMGQQQNQLIQNRVLQQQQQQQGQNFNQQLNQHILNQKQQMFGQQQINTSQQQQQNLISQPQFVNQNQFEAMQQQQQQKINQNQQQLSVQALNQQLQHQNLGQQLNQQLMQQNQQTQQTLGLDQNLGIIGQPQGGIITQQQQQQGGIPQQLNAGMGQQVIRTPQFQQQVLVNQGQQQNGPRAQLNQQIWVQQQQQQQGGQIPGQQIIRHPVNVAVQQNAAAPGAVGPRIQWPAGQQPQRQLIHLDAHTHNQLQKLPPEQQALFVAKLQQKQRQIQLAKQVQQRPGGHILIRGNVPQGLTPQQQVQWLQQQAKQQGIVLPPNIQQSITQGNITPQQAPPQSAAVSPQHAPGLSPINQPNAAAVAASVQPQQQQQFAAAGEQTTAQQLQLRQYRLQQLQLQREQAQKNALAQQGAIPQQAVIRPPLAGQPAAADSTTNPQVQVNPKTKTALANMLSIKLQSGGTIGAPVRQENIPEPSAAGTLRMMTAQHNAAINSKPQEIIALQQQQQQQQQQRRVITGPNGEILKPAGAATLPLTPQADPPKLQFNTKAAVPVQHRVGPFYGHNPNLKLPPDLFLLGCIFVVVEVEDFLDEKIPGWQQKIEKYGGEVEKQYCSKVTHVLCETQRHGVVMQALRDLKRCVTIRWLSDVMKRKQVLPPWTALHLPQIYLDITPASKHLISVSGFEGNLRQIVRQMIKYTGAKCTNYFSKHNTLLICAKAEGKKFNHAKKWNIPVVNVQWLTDIILGNFSALNQMDNQIYQNYSNPPNLSFDPKLVPNVMHAWKAPINISQESYERVKRSASPVSLPKAKKMKTEHTDENENITGEEVTNPDYKILFSQFEPERLKELEKMVRDLGGCISKDHKDFTHLVIPKLIRSHKLLFAIVKSSHLLPEKWLEDSLNSKTFLPEVEYHLPTQDFNQNFNITFESVLCKPEKHKLLENKCFWITPSVIPNKKIICELIELSGGKIERIRRSRAQIDAACAATPNTYFIVTAKEDLHLVADLLKQKNKDKQKVVCNVELVLSAILKQEFEVEPYAVSVV